MKNSDNKPYVLIVDDIDENLLVMEKLLKKLDVVVIKSGSGNDALKQSLYYDFSLIILDILMPDMSGYDVADLLKKTEKTSEVPIIFVTAMDKDDIMEIKGYSKGAVDFIFKPFNDYIFTSKVKVLLELFKMRKNYENAMLKRSEDKPQILIVDDNPENLIALELLLKNLDAVVVKANSGNEALSQTLYTDYALIILDVQMPEMDGYEVAEILKSEDKTANIPIIFVTAINRDDTKEIMGYDKGAVDFIFKPFNEYILISKVKIFLEIYKMKAGLGELVAERTRDLKEINDKLTEEIQKHKNTEKELLGTRAYLTNVLNAISSALIGIDSDGTISNYNMEAQKITGVSYNDARGKKFTEIFTPYSDFYDEMMAVISKDEQFERTKITVKKGDKQYKMNLTAYPLVDNAVNGAVIRIDDVTERVRLEEMMIQSEKILMVGGLAAGMAHEINNPLAGIMQNMQVIQNRVKKDIDKNEEIAKECGTSIDMISDYMDRRGIMSMTESILESGRRAAQIVDNMLSFSRKSKSRFVPHQISNLLDQTVELAGSDYDLKKKYDFRKIEIIREYDNDIPEVSCDSSKLQQVFLNILKNGAEAMEKIDNNPRFILSLKKKDKYVHIEIEDNGHGMDEVVRKKVFEPFFTTKDAGIGTGLGLSVSYFIITENHSGTIEVESSPGEGAKFIIHLPYHPTL